MDKDDERAHAGHITEHIAAVRPSGDGGLHLVRDVAYVSGLPRDLPAYVG